MKKKVRKERKAKICSACGCERVLDTELYALTGIKFYTCACY